MKKMTMLALLFAGTLAFAAEASRWGVFQNGKITAKDPVRVESVAGKTEKATGIRCNLSGYVPGKTNRVTFLARGKGNLEGMIWSKNLNRVNFKRSPLSSEWQEFSVNVAVPEDETSLALAVFFWNQQDVHFELKDLSVKAE